MYSRLLSSHHRQCGHLLSLSPFLLRCSLSTLAPQKEVSTSFIAQYLISSLGIPADRAVKCSGYKALTRIKTPEQPNSVVSFLKQIGLSDSQIRTVVLFDPTLLSTNVDKILRPRAQALMDAGFTAEILFQLVQTNPQCFSRKDTLSRLLFWSKFVGQSDELLSKVVQRNKLLISFDIDKHVLPKLNLFKEFGLSNQDITNMLVRGQVAIFRRLESLRQNLERTKELGFPRGSAMFVHGLHIIGCNRKETLQRKVEFFKKMYGWSDEDCYSAFRKFPYVLGYSEEKVKLNMEFLIGKLKLEPRSIASWPKLLGFSLEKRLVPRHHVMSFLESKGLKNNIGFVSVMAMTEKQFLEKFVVPNVRNMPRLSEAYATASGGKLLVDS